MYFVSVITVGFVLVTYVGFALNNNVGVLGEHVADGFIVFDSWAFIVDVLNEYMVHFFGAEIFVVAGFEFEGVGAIVIVAAVAFSIERGGLKGFRRFEREQLLT